MVIIHSILTEIHFTMKNNDNELFCYGLELIPNELFINPNICLIYIDLIFMSYQLVLAYFFALLYVFTYLSNLSWRKEKVSFSFMLCNLFSYFAQLSKHHLRSLWNLMREQNWESFDWSGTICIFLRTNDCMLKNWLWHDK